MQGKAPHGMAGQGEAREVRWHGLGAAGHGKDIFQLSLWGNMQWQRL
jgi:hypothetical protein